MLMRNNIYVLYAYKLIRLTKSAGAWMYFFYLMVIPNFFSFQSVKRYVKVIICAYKLYKSSLSAYLNWSKSITKIKILLFDFIR